MLSKIISGLAILGILIGCLIGQHLYIKDLSANNAVMTAQLNDLKEQSKAQAERFDAARKKAEEDAKHSQFQTKQIMLADVSPNCKKAIKWGIQQAQGFKQ